MKRDWLTLAFGIGLVGAVLALSLRQHMTREPGPAGGTEPAVLAASPPAGRTAPALDLGATPVRIEPNRPVRAPADPAERPRNGPLPALSAAMAGPPPVRLNAAIPVVHRHAMGSCQGMLAATSNGLSFETSNASDAFTVAFADMDEFEVDYLKKNLRVRRRAGRTWNFTNDSADALFVFHRDVSKAREKLTSR